MSKLSSAAIYLLLSFSVSSLAHAQEPSEQPAKRIGIGYKAGNGIGFSGGDLIIGVLPHLVLDVQVAAVSGFDSGFAVAPAVQGYLYPRTSSPYIGAGVQHIRISLGDVKANGTGYFANLGYEWRWDHGLGILVGGGVQYLDEITATNGTQSASVGGGFNPNIELGLRYRFL